MRMKCVFKVEFAELGLDESLEAKMRRQYFSYFLALAPEGIVERGLGL